MDFGIIELDDDVLAFWNDEVRPFFDEYLADDVLERERREGNGIIPELQRALGARGWLAPAATATAANEPGGVGIDALRSAIVDAEEGLRAGPLLPAKGSHNLVVAVIRAFGSDELKATVLPKATRGEVSCCLGYTEPDCGSDAAAVTTRAVRDGDEWVITGQKMFTTGAQLAGYVMATARTNTAAPQHQGITMFLVATDLPGVEIQGIGTLGGERTNFVYLDGVRVPDTHRLGPVDQGWQVASGALATEHGLDAEHGGLPHDEGADADADASAAESAAHARAALGRFGPGWTNELGVMLAAAVEWARTSTRPDGSHPIDDPLVRLRLAQVALDAEIGSVTPPPYERIIVSDLFIRDAADLIDMTGPYGVLPRGEDGAAADGAIEHAHRFAQGTSIYGGTTDIQRNLIAEHFLGLPRHRGAIRR